VPVCLPVADGDRPRTGSRWQDGQMVVVLGLVVVALLVYVIVTAIQGRRR
jgi:hypothetical protein